MKKIIALLLSLTLVMSMLVACGKKEATDKKADPTAAPTSAPAAEDKKDNTANDTAAPAAAKTGLAVVTSLTSSKNATEDADGTAQIDSTVAAVLVGQDGKILKCSIDVAQTKVKFSKDGKLLTDLATAFQSKQELKEAYGMKKASGIGKEWNEQADAFEAYVIGKTIDQVKGIALGEDGKATEADLTSSVTVHINEFIEAVEKAVAGAQDLGAKEGDKLGLAIVTNIAKSKDATAEAAGLAQAYSYYTATTVAADGKISSCIIDASQGNVNFDATGVITTDLTVAPQTKQELKEAYNMKKASGIGKEWYEQANAFAAYVTGKTVAEVDGIAMTDGVPSVADLTSSVTVHATDFVTAIDKAVATAE